MVFTFFKAKGYDVGSSLVEEDKLELASRLTSLAKEKGVELILPSDVLCANKFSADADSQVSKSYNIPNGDCHTRRSQSTSLVLSLCFFLTGLLVDGLTGWMGLDIGPQSIEHFNDVLQTAKVQIYLSCKHSLLSNFNNNAITLSACSQMVLWNGPMGVFEFDKFSKGTYAVANTLAKLTDKGCVTIIGGGDSVAAVEKAGVAAKMSHISTGGGASLELLEGKVLPGVAVLDDVRIHA